MDDHSRRLFQINSSIDAVLAAATELRIQAAMTDDLSKRAALQHLARKLSFSQYLLFDYRWKTADEARMMIEGVTTAPGIANADAPVCNLCGAPAE